MSSPLPDGFIDTGIIMNCHTTASGQFVRLRNDFQPNWVEPAGNGANRMLLGFGPGMYWEIYDDDITPVGTPDTLNIRAKLYQPGTTPAVYYMEGIPLLFLPPPGPFRPRNEFIGPDVSSTFDMIADVGPYRLGVRCEPIDGHEYDQPLFAQHMKLVYNWFADSDTRVQTSLNNHSASWVFGTEPPMNLGLLAGQLIFGFERLGAGIHTYVEFSNLSVNGPVDTTGLAATAPFGLGTGLLKGTGGGNAEGKSEVGGNTGYITAGAQPGYQLNEDFEVSRFGLDTTGARMLDGDGATFSVPHQAFRAVPQAGWSTPGAPFHPARSLFIDGDWAVAQPVPFRSDDLRALFSMGPRSVGPGHYYPVGLTVTFELNLLRPDGNRPSDWVSSDTSKIMVTENSTDTVFHVSGIGADVARTLVSDWRRRVGLGTLGTSDPDFAIEAYLDTKHYAGEDIYAWDLYTQMELDITAPADDVLMVQIEGNYLSVYDPHTTGSDRVDNYSASLTPFTYQYEVPISSGRGTYYVDLCFPTNADGPVYPSRIDKVTLSGFSHVDEDYTLNEWELEARGYAYVKIDFGPPVQRGDYSAVMISIDGSFGLGNLPDQAYKGFEVGAYGGGARYVVPLTGAVTGTILDNQLSLAAFWGYLDRIEGLTATYYAAISEAALKDSFGNTLGPEIAQWLEPVVPHAVLTPGTEWRPPCSVRVGEVIMPGGIQFTTTCQWNAGFGAIETLVADEDGGRAEPGIELTAGYDSYGVTDEFGYAIIAPVPANGDLSYTVSASP